MTTPTPPLDRILARLEFDESGCWIYQGKGNGSGYGRTYVYELGRSVVTHRVAYEVLVEPVPDDMVLDHLCRVTKCINPDHLEVVPQQENTRRGVGPTAVNATKAHCKRGHEFTPENTYVIAPSATRTKPGRQCLTCRAEYHAAYYGRAS